MAHKNSDEVANKMGIMKSRDHFDVSCKTYTNFIFLSKINRWLFPLTLFAFLLPETCLILFYRFLASFDDLKNKDHAIFGDNDRLYWGIIGMLLGLYFILMSLKYIMLNLVVLFSNEDIHETMVLGLVRSPSWYFDVTPSGDIINKFSNDLGILDSNLNFVLMDSIEGPIICLILLSNIFSIDLFFLIPGVINIVFLVFYFMFCKGVIRASKELDLRTKTPVFSRVGEMINGLIQIKIFNRRYNLLK